MGRHLRTSEVPLFADRPEELSGDSAGASAIKLEVLPHDLEAAALVVQDLPEPELVLTRKGRVFVS